MSSTNQNHPTVTSISEAIKTLQEIDRVWVPSDVKSVKETIKNLQTAKSHIIKVFDVIDKF